MRKNNLTALLTDLRALILNSRPAYRDFLGEVTEAKTTKILENVVLAEGQMMLPVADAAFSGFIAGEAYRVVLDGEEKSVVAKDSSEGAILSNVEDISNPPNDAWGLMYYSEAGKMIASTSGAFLGAKISVYYDDMVTKQKWSVRKLAYELLPDRLLSALSAAANTARKALTAANAAQSTANAAQSTANAAQSTANAAQSTANNIVMAASSQGVVSTKTITNIGEIGGLGVAKRYTAKGLNIQVNSFVTVTESSFGTVSMRWNGHSAVAKFPGSGPTIYLDYQVGTDTYTLSKGKGALLTIEKMEYTEVPLSPSGTIALPYLQFPHILLYSGSGTGKLFEITVNDAGTLSATEVTDTTT
jgi:hypothetical protein